MNAQAIIDRALRLTHTNSTDYTSTQSVEDLNLVYQEVVDTIVNEVDEDYFWDIAESNTVVWQSEYLAETIWIAPDDLDIKKVNKVYIKYSASDTYYTKANFLNPWSLDKDTDWYKDNHSKSNPFFYIQDTSLFIYPAPTEAVTNWLKLYVIHTPADLTATSTESEIEIPYQFHKVIATGMKQYIYASQWKINEKNDAINEFEIEKERMVFNIQERYNQPWITLMPNLTIYE